MKKIIIVAHTENLVIGKNGKIPWNIKEEMQHFVKTTVGNVVIMGRNTYLSLNQKPLKNRENVVITKHDVSKGFTKFESLEEAYDHYDKLGKEKVYIIGGAKLYQEALTTADEAIISTIFDKYDGDVYFPIDVSMDCVNWDLKSVEIFYKEETESMWADILSHDKSKMLFEIAYYERIGYGE